MHSLHCVNHAGLPDQVWASFFFNLCTEMSQSETPICFPSEMFCHFLNGYFLTYMCLWLPVLIATVWRPSTQTVPIITIENSSWPWRLWGPMVLDAWSNPYFQFLYFLSKVFVIGEFSTGLWWYMEFHSRAVGTPAVCSLTHWGRDKIETIVQTFSNAIIEWKCLNSN